MLTTLIVLAPVQAEADPPLNSDFIRKRFGNYHVSVLAQHDEIRITNLYSITSGVAVCRTLAATHFIIPVAPTLIAADTRIRSGDSIGATLHQLGFTVSKTLLIETWAESGRQFESLAPNIETGTSVSIKVYVLQASKDGQTDNYAVIAEAYHPEHTPPLLSPVTDETMAKSLKQLSEHALSAVLNAL